MTSAIITMIDIFSRFNLIHYTTPEGEMCCPVFVRTKEDAQKWLQQPCKWVDDPILKRWKMVPGMTVETREKAVEKKKTPHPKKAEGFRRQKEHRILQINPETHEVVALWESASEAAMALGISRQNIHHALSNRQEKSGGYIWRHYCPTTKYKGLDF